LNDSFDFDVIVIGAGPAGGKCALELAKKGIKTLLVERFENFDQNNFSSAGMLTSTLNEFDIPTEIVGQYWSNFVVHSSGKLKSYFATQFEKNGGKLLLHTTYVSKKHIKNGVAVELFSKKNNEKRSYTCKLLVDATGPARKVMYDHNETQPKMISAIGIEYLIQVSDNDYNKFKNDLVFILGQKWCNDGYSWIFPMHKNILKVGSGRIQFDSKKNTSLKEITENLISNFMNIAEYSIIDVHGGNVRIADKYNDIFYKNRVLAIGDAVSTINPLGAEGIKYAIEHAEMNIPYIVKFVKSNKNRFYVARFKWRKKYLLKWKICLILSKRIYKYTDSQIDSGLKKYIKLTSKEDVIENLFRFNFKNIRKKIVKIVYQKLRKKVFGNFSK
jgi:digeranylgeranylglycerophospholipid reductase